MSDSARVLVAGGAGGFGSRLVELLCATTNAHVIVAGRSAARANAAAQRFGAKQSLALDRDRVTAGDIAATGAAVVVDAAGPFQGADLRFARAVLAAGADHVDLADARDYVAVFPQLNALAEHSGRVAITGASSTPALSHAAIDALCRNWRRIDVIRAGIAPGNRAPRGRSLVAAILSWAGRPVRVFEDGAWRVRRGWSDCGATWIEGLGRRRFALAETPDLDLLVARYAPTDNAVFCAALELPLLHHGVSVLGALRWLWRKPDCVAGVVKALSDLLLPFGGDRGAMFVEVLGRDQHDHPTCARWTLIAPDNHGPYVPVLPALAMVRKLISGDRPAPGARPCVGMMSLQDIASDCARLGIATHATQQRLRSPFERALGAAFTRAPAAIVNGHTAGPVARLVGEARVVGAVSPLGALAARVTGFPGAAARTTARVVMRLYPDGSETWRREIGGRPFTSRLQFVRPGVVSERFGAMTFDMAVDAGPVGVTMRVIGWRIGPIPLPRLLAPRSLAREFVDAKGRFCFDVPIALPLLGRITHYSGHLTQAKGPWPA